MIEYLKNNPSLILYTLIAVGGNIFYLYNYDADAWYWCLWLPMSVIGIGLYINDYFKWK